MKIAIMQPYLFPYLGYFQLMHCVDRFVLFDNVNYIKKGWINRNRILVNGREYLFTIPLTKVSQNKYINQILLLEDNGWKSKFLKTVSESYRQAPFYKDAFPLIEEIIGNEERNLSEYISGSLYSILQYLGLLTEIVFSSEINETAELKGADRIINICRLENAGTYVNLPGGKDLYSKEIFALNDIRLCFLEPEPVLYKQGRNESFVPGLSIVDVLMWNSVETINGFLKKYRLA